ncbi:MAG TPA: polyprenyl synthetase family protein [Ferrovibrio sp.]|uniref:polyprenyl synthetase family protein n=1 Tax=Ferrovibrio sp. TaxID=1917215 RepID=UPI002B4B8F7E|nr:polyprenyl synthetase family protein [Ferrovibrio sp.]HLT77796.1 polyprenyl synthetase family protein [Ferrovibrio sp.]
MVQTAPKTQFAEARTPSIEPLRQLVADDMAAVNREILARMASEVSLIPELASHLIAAGGKRIRPLLTLGAARLCGYRGDKHVLLAACVEFIHTATLLHDDVVDESERRRGNSTANVLWGNQPSVLVGDFLFSRAFQLMVETGSLEVLRILANASAVIAEGEVLQLMTANDMDSTEADYLRVIEAKTAALFAAATRVGAVIAGRPEPEVQAMDDYGRFLGIAFQLVDDALDYSSDGATLGKNTGDDFREGKVTLPVALAFDRGTEAERGFWRRVIERPEEQNDDDWSQALRYLERHGTIAETLERARLYGHKAHEALAVFPAVPAREALAEAVDFAIGRAL